MLFIFIQMLYMFDSAPDKHFIQIRMQVPCFLKSVHRCQLTMCDITKDRIARLVTTMTAASVWIFEHVQKPSGSSIVLAF